MSTIRPPTITPAGDMLPYMSAARRRRALDTVFEMVGGVDRLAHEATKSSEGYWNFTKIWAKGPLPVTQNNTTHDVNASSVESLWKKLDERKRAKEAGRLHETVVIDVEVQDDNNES